MLKYLAFIVAVLAAPSAWAQCNPSVRTGVPFNCAPAPSANLSDLILGGSKTGATSGQTVAFTVGQLIAADHSQSPVTATGGSTQTLATWMSQLAALSTKQITIGGQSVTLGGATQNQGNGPLIALATGSFTAGHCRQTDASGNEVDSGGPCGGGGVAGGGTVTNGTANSLAWYSATGTSIAGLTTANNGVLITSGAGVPSISATLPNGLTIPSPTISNPTVSGTDNVANLTATGKITAAASTTSAAGLNLGQGTAPTSPVNGDIWITSSGVSARVNGATVALNGAGGGLSSVTASSPLAGAGTSGSPLTCTTCVTSTSGGALAVSSPLTLSGATIGMGAVPGSALVQWPTNTTVSADTYYYTLSWPWNTGTITGVTYATGGTNTPSFSIAVQVNGASVTGCSGITVSSATATSATCTAANTITKGQKVTLAVSAVSGTPNAAQVQIAYTRSGT